MLRPEGSWVAIATPFSKEGEVDFRGFERIVDFHVENGTDGLLLMGSTGEATLLSMEEKRAIVDRVLAYAKGRIPVFAGTTSSNTRETIQLTEYAARAGADGALLVVPPYVRPPQEDIYQHFKAVAEAVDIPIALYNNPTRVGVNIEPETIIRLVEFPNVVADKEAMGNIDQLAKVMVGAGDKINLLCCDYPGYGLILPTLALGGHGTANIAGNIIPQEMAALSRPWRTWEDVERSRRLYFKFLPLLRALYSASNPIAVKAAMRALGLPAGLPRCPLSDLPATKQESLIQLLEELRVMEKYGRGGG